MDTVSAFHSTWFDAVLLGIIAVSVIVSFFRGFLREAISLCSWVIGIGLALKFSSAIAHNVFSWIHSTVAAYIVAIPFNTLVANQPSNNTAATMTMNATI